MALLDRLKVLLSESQACSRGTFSLETVEGSSMLLGCGDGVEGPLESDEGVFDERSASPSSPLSAGLLPICHESTLTGHHLHRLASAPVSHLFFLSYVQLPFLGPGPHFPNMDSQKSQGGI